MLVYRPQCERVDVRARLRALIGEAECVDLSNASASRDLLVDLGELEAGVVDDRFERVDGLSPLADAWRQATVAAASLFLLVLGGDRETAGARRAALSPLLEALARGAPKRVDCRPPEGFVQYGLFPEQYAAAAAIAFARHRPERAVVIGLRSIGTTLAAVVAARLEEAGCAAVSLTLRPRGHPLDRAPTMTPELAAWISARARDALVLLVDEGPGLSGSSLTGTARALVALGVRDEQILFLPSRLPDASTLISPSARRTWPRHHAIVADFDPRWIAALDAPFEDLSAGAWRNVLGAPGAVIHPWHERRKYLVRGDGAPRLLKFSAVGRRGLTARKRGEALADAGWGPPLLARSDGFLAFDLCPEEPADPTAVDRPWLGAIAHYLAFVARAFPADAACVTPPEALAQMARINAVEALGTRVAQCLDALRLPLIVPVWGDARMLPHEWLRAPSGRPVKLVKTDGIDHAAEHFYPGATDIAWDLAGAIAELRLEPAASEALMDAYRQMTGDDARARLPSYHVAYLAYRAAYATLSATGLRGTAEGDAFAAAALGYQRDLASAIGVLDRAR